MRRKEWRMECKAYYSEVAPQRITFEVHNDGNWVWLRKNIAREEVTEGEDTFYQYSCDEVFFKTGATEEEILEDFDAYYEYGAAWVEDEVAPTLEERVSASEDAIAELTDAIFGVLLGGSNV